MNLAKRIGTTTLVAAAMLGGLLLAGCDDNSVEVIRDPDIHITKGMTWAWRPMNAPAPAKRDAEGRPVISRDLITQPQEPAPGAAPQQHLESNREWNTEANRDRLKQAIDKGLRSKGLVRVDDPEKADLLVDYHVSVRTSRGAVQEMYPGWGWGLWGPPAVWYRPVTVNSGRFVIDLGLRNPKKLAYRAIGRRGLGYDYKRTISPSQADEAVSHLLKGLHTK